MKNPILSTVLTFLLFIAARPGVAGIVEIPLVTEADAEPWADHTVAFDAGMPLPDVVGVSLRIEGEGGGVPYVSCMDFRYAGSGDGRIVVGLLGGNPGPVPAEATHDFGAGERQPFALTLAFAGTDFGFLASGRGSLRIEDPAGMYSDSSGHYCPVGNGCVIATATLIVKYGDLVDTGVVTWSTLKAIYR